MVEVGQTISGKYKLLRLLGDGGMGSVWEAEHTTLGTHVAIKVLHGDLARRAGLIERFLQEARVSAQIKSPHVVMVHDVDRTPEGVAYLVMELLQGEPLGSVIKRQGRMAVETACEYAVQILEALEAAHSLGVIHRDLKPDNVFVTFQGGKPVLKLIDFGIAKLKRAEGTKNLTVAGMLMGTPEYMAPEQAYAADKVDVRADLYAVGVMLYEMLSGQPPVSGPDPRILVAKIERGEVTPLVHAAPGIRPELAGFVHRAMAPRPEMRFANATAMKVDLRGVMAGKKTNVGTAPLKASVVPALPPELMDTDRQPPPVGTGTVMGAPMAGAMSMGPHPGAPTPMVAGPSIPYEASRPLPRRRSGSGLVIALALIATLLGAGAVVAYVMSTQDTTPAPPPTFATAPPTQPPVTPPTLASTTVTAAPPLKPTQPLTPTTPVNPPPVAKPDAGTSPSQPPQAQPDAGGTIVTTPTDAGGAIITIPGVGSVPIPGPGERPPFWPPNQPWPPAAPTWPPPPQ